jgi:hypothetical protein
MENGVLQIMSKEENSEIQVGFTAEEKMEIMRELKFKEGERRECSIMCECFSASFLLPESPLLEVAPTETPQIQEVPVVPTISEPEVSETAVKEIVTTIPVEEILKQESSELEEIAGTPKDTTPISCEQGEN